MSKQQQILDGLDRIEELIRGNNGHLQAKMKPAAKLVTPYAIHFQDGDYPGIIHANRLVTVDHMGQFTTEHYGDRQNSVTCRKLEFANRINLELGDIAFMTDQMETDFTNIYSYFLILDREWAVSWTAQDGINRTMDTYRQIWQVIL